MNNNIQSDSSINWTHWKGQCHSLKMRVGCGAVDRCSVLAALLSVIWYVMRVNIQFGGERERKRLLDSVVSVVRCWYELWLWRDVVGRQRREQRGMQIGPDQTCYLCCSGKFRLKHCVILHIACDFNYAACCQTRPPPHTHICTYTQNSTKITLIRFSWCLEYWILEYVMVIIDERKWKCRVTGCVCFIHTLM